MDDLKHILDSGLIEDYCLGLLEDEQASYVTKLAKEHNSVRQLVEETLNAMVKLSASSVDHIPISKHSSTRSLIQNLISAKQNIQFKRIEKNSSLSDWIHVLDYVPKLKFIDGIGYYKLARNDHFEQVMMQSFGELTEDDHDEIEESFFIIQGSCECTFEDKIIHLKAGQYLDIPKGVKHTIRNTSEQGPVTAIVQRIRKAA